MKDPDLDILQLLLENGKLTVFCRSEKEAAVKAFFNRNMAVFNIR
jgi:hypothetical protein